VERVGRISIKGEEMGRDDDKKSDGDDQGGDKDGKGNTMEFSFKYTHSSKPVQGNIFKYCHLDAYTPLKVTPSVEPPKWSNSLDIVLRSMIPSGLMLSVSDYLAQRKEIKLASVGISDALDMVKRTVPRIDYSRIVRSGLIGGLIIAPTALLRDGAFAYVMQGLTKLFDHFPDKDNSNLNTNSDSQNENKQEKTVHNFKFGSDTSSRDNAIFILSFVGLPYIYYKLHTFWVSAGYLFPTTLHQTGSLTSAWKVTASLQAAVSRAFLIPTGLYVSAMAGSIYYFSTHGSGSLSPGTEQDVYTAWLFAIGVVWYRWLILKGRGAIHAHRPLPGGGVGSGKY